jgi:hypothetical protein
MFDKYNDYVFVAVDFDRTVVSGHMHQYFMTLYSDKSPNQIMEMYSEKSADDFKELLREIAIFTYLNDDLNFVNNLFHPDRKELCNIFRSSNVIEQLNNKYKKDFGAFQPFIAEKEFKEFLEYRIDHELPTVVVSNSMFSKMIAKTLFVLLGEYYNIKIYTPNCDSEKTIKENVKERLYLPHNDKNGLLARAKEESGSVLGKSVLIDDESKNCIHARKLGFETEDTPPMYDPFITLCVNTSSDTVYDEPFGSRSPSPLGELCTTPPATISGKVSSSSSTALRTCKVEGVDTCPTFDEESVESLVDKLDRLAEEENRKRKSGQVTGF